MKIRQAIRRRPWLVPVLLFLLLCLHPLGLRLNLTTSQPKGLYRLQRGFPENLQAHQLMLVHLPYEIAAFGAERGYLDHAELAKCVAALPGDSVEVSAHGLVISGVPLSNTAPLPLDSKGRPIAAYREGLYDTLPGTLWLYSNHIPNSWDSRYFGPVPTLGILGRLVPLITWPPFPRNSQGEITCNWHPTPQSTR